MTENGHSLDRDGAGRCGATKPVDVRRRTALPRPVLLVDDLIVDLGSRLPRHIRWAALSFLPFCRDFDQFATGILFAAADPMMYWPNPAFRLKMF
jgi:hypothetical protein